MAPRDIYTHRLGKLEIGYPLFEPSTAELGDIGFINKSGGFIKLYNVAKPPKVNNAPPSRALKVTPPVRLEDSAQHVTRDSAIGGNAGVQLPQVPVGGKLAFQNVQSKEVIIIMKNQMRRGIQEIGDLKKYFKDYLPWIKREYQRREDFADRDLCLVTGTREAAYYSIAVNDKRATTASISFEVYKVAEGGVWGNWENTTMYNETSLHNNGLPITDDVNNVPRKAVFIKRIALKRHHIFGFKPDELLGERRENIRYSEEDFTEDENPAEDKDPDLTEPEEPNPSEEQSEGTDSASRRKEHSDEMQRSNEKRQSDQDEVTI